MRLLRYTLLIILLYVPCAAQTGIHKRIIVLGNASESFRADNHLLDLIKANIPLDSNTIILYLGNNARDEDDTKSLQKEADLIAGSGASAIFVPGYRDWNKGVRGGLKDVRQEEKFLEGLGNDAIKVYPGKGCPGPKEVDLGNDAVLIIMDSQWWLQKSDKPDVESDCKYRTKEELLAEIEDLPEEHINKLVLFAMYHPLENTGIHSGTFGLKQHIFPLTDLHSLRWAYLPLPVVGSIYPVTRNAIAGSQDENSDAYQALSENGIGNIPGIKEAFQDHPHTIFIGGQERNLQLLERNNKQFIVSGAGGHPGRVRNGRGVEYAREKAGFAMIEISADKKVTSRFYIVDNGKLKEDFSKQLMDYSVMPLMGRDTAKAPMTNADRITAVASKNLGKAGPIKRMLVGTNYRREWRTPVNMPVLHLDKEKGGLEITGIGGGHESKSLQLKDATGREWVFRTSNKQLDAVIPEGFQHTIASEYVQDMLSASNPYGSLAVPGLQTPLGIPHAKPQLYFMPNDPALGPYRPVFANQVGTLEEKSPVTTGDKVVNSMNAINSMISSGDHFADQEMYLKTRFVDFLIADFDRHHGQYSWVKHDSDGRDFYYPVPKDRDQTFYHNTGLVMKIMRHGGFQFMTNFPDRIKNIKNNGIVGAYLDVLFTNKLSAADWKRNLESFQATLTDEVMDDAVSRMPAEIQAVRGKTIRAKLKSRRESLVENGMKYHRFISRKVNIPGGNKDDVFRISSTAHGLQVKVYTTDSTGDSSLVYSRVFDPSYTRELRLYGFNGDDYFEVDEAARSGIKLRVVGGKGDDTYSMQGRVANRLYDLNYENNVILHRRRTVKLFSRHPSVNEFQLREVFHNRWSLPMISFAVNQDDGPIIGAGITHTSFGFHKYPYASQQNFSAAYAPQSGAFKGGYRGEFIDVIRRYDVLFNAGATSPVLAYFFGFGNETIRDTTKDFTYYRTRYSTASADLLLRKRFPQNRVVSLSAGPSFFYYWNNPERNYNKVLQNPELIGLDSGRVYSDRMYAGGKAVFAINTLNNALLPYRGINWSTELTALQAVNGNSHSYSKLVSTLDLYSVLRAPSKVLVGLHFGAGHIFSKNFEYFQALTLGGNNYLRGYRVSRFAGASMAYASAELRVKLFAFNTYIVKGDFGLVGFNDVGRVWMPNEKSTKWHNGYGGGVYLVPFNSAMLSFVVGISDEDQLLNMSLGTRINMVFQGL